MKKTKEKPLAPIKPRRPKQPLGGATLLPKEAVEKIATMLTKQIQKEERDRKYAPVKEVLALLGHGAVLAAAFLAPKSAPALLPIIQGTSNWDMWKQYNVSYLQRTLRRLEQQKDVEITEKDGKQIIALTKNGARKILKYSIDALAVEKPKRWDTMWRLVLYDVPVKEKRLGDVMRQALRAIGFYAIQDSVYVFPYPCFNQIEFLREYYNLGDKIQYMLVQTIERDAAFKTYFGLS